MLEELGADTVSCPMIAIRDVPDTAPVEAWLRRFADGTCDDLVLMTGEGLRRLLGFARRIDLESAFIAALGLTRKITRGPSQSARCERSDWLPTCPPTNPRPKALSRRWNGMTSPGGGSACSYIPAMRMSDF